MGFATVSLRIRGTGYQGGAFDLFGLPSDYDASFDAVPLVGAQPWYCTTRSAWSNILLGLLAAGGGRD